MQTQAMWPWIKAARPVGHGVIALPLLLGQGLALSVDGSFSWQWFCFAQLFGLLIQVHTLYLNDYADEALDRNNQDYWLSGGSRVIPDGQLTGNQLYRASFLVAGVLLVTTLFAVTAGRPYALAFAAVALFASWSYSLKPLRSSYRGWGEIHQGLSCGVGLPLWAYYLQVGSLNAFPWLLLLPLFSIFLASNIVTALPDINADRQGGKRTYPVRHGVRKAKRDAVLISLLAAVALMVVFAYRQFTGSTILLVAGLPALWFIGLLFSGVVNPNKNAKRFMLLIMLGQLWLLIAWVVQLYSQ